MLVSEDYPWGKLLREYATYCGVGCINVVVFFILYYWLYGMQLLEDYPAATAWAISYFVSSWQAHYLHRWLTFESPSEYTKSLAVTNLENVLSIIGPPQKISSSLDLNTYLPF